MQRFDFLKNKYDKELLVDFGRVENLKNYILDSDLHYITFYEVLIITEGSGYYSLDNETIPIRSGMVVVTLPNQIRRWKIKKPVKGFSFFFEGEFLNNYFRDEVFLNRFAIFDYSRQYIFTHLVGEPFMNLRWVLDEVGREFFNLKGDSSHIFRSLLYYTISLIDRKYNEQHHIERPDNNQTIYRFKKLLDLHVKRWHTVVEYAKALDISHNHLNTHCKKYLAKTALQILHERILLEAKRELQFSGNTVGEIAFSLGFSDVSNFNRMFKKATKSTPHSYRLKINSYC